MIHPDPSSAGTCWVVSNYLGYPWCVSLGSPRCRNGLFPSWLSVVCVAQFTSCSDGQSTYSGCPFCAIQITQLHWWTVHFWLSVLCHSDHMLYTLDHVVAIHGIYHTKYMLYISDYVVANRSTYHSNRMLYIVDYVVAIHGMCHTNHAAVDCQNHVDPQKQLSVVLWWRIFTCQIRRPAFQSHCWR